MTPDYLPFALLAAGAAGWLVLIVLAASARAALNRRNDE